MKTSTRIAALALLLVGAHAAFMPVMLPVPLDGLEPAISSITMNYHYNTHYMGYINKINAAFSNGQMPATLTDAIESVANPGTVNATTIRKQGGGAWNHGLYFKILAAPNSAANQASALSNGLSSAINNAFPSGGIAALQQNMTAAAMEVFGSGWAWLCVLPGGGLTVTTTPNQDNPLMGTTISNAPLCTPILGIDVWEHAYYADRGPARKDYVDAFWSVVNWAQVSQNYASAVSGMPNQIVS